MTAEEFLALPNDDMRHELIDGEVRTIAPASGGHGDHAGSIHVHIGRFCYDNPIARVLSAKTGFLVRRNPDRVRAPDVAVVRVENVPPGVFRRASSQGPRPCDRGSLAGRQGR
jgi:Uma2 family endonuclease